MQLSEKILRKSATLSKKTEIALNCFSGETGEYEPPDFKTEEYVSSDPISSHCLKN
jgi:hypothetical protein